jgi:glycosyltransferase involved in cell wall biosynthesis
METIDRAVASAAEQSVRPKELFLVDDGSPDDTLAQLYALQSDYGADWVHVLPLTENQGPATARNRGWDAAIGHYIAFLDADDAWHQDKLKTQWGWMRHHSAVVLSGHYRPMVSAAGHQDSLKGSVPLSVDAIPARQVTPSQLLRSNHFPTSSVMLKRDIPYRFVEEKRACEDFHLWCEICLDGNACYVLPLDLAFTYKPAYGASGLGANLWAMFRGEFDVYARLKRSGRLSTAVCVSLLGWSWLKFLRRVVLTGMRRLHL